MRGGTAGRATPDAGPVTAEGVPTVHGGAVFAPDASGPVIRPFDVRADNRLQASAQLSFASVGNATPLHRVGTGDVDPEPLFSFDGQLVRARAAVASLRGVARGVQHAVLRQHDRRSRPRSAEDLEVGSTVENTRAGEEPPGPRTALNEPFPRAERAGRRARR